MPDKFWTEERIATITRMWCAGSTAAEIADAIGTSRNAVIGKLDRIGARPGRHGRRAPTQTVRKRREKPSKPRPLALPMPPLPTQPDAPPTQPVSPAGAPTAGRITILELTERTCRWPEEPRFFCGALPEPGLPYCKAHSRFAFTKVNERKQLWRSLPLARAR